MTLYQTKNLLPFLNSKKEEDVKKIEELAGEIEELNIKSSDIKKLIDIISFIEMLKGKKPKKDKDFLSFFYRCIIKRH